MKDAADNLDIATIISSMTSDSWQEIINFANGSDA